MFVSVRTSIIIDFSTRELYIIYFLFSCDYIYIFIHNPQFLILCSNAVFNTKYFYSLFWFVYQKVFNINISYHSHTNFKSLFCTLLLILLHFLFLKTQTNFAFSFDNIIIVIKCYFNIKLLLMCIFGEKKSKL